MTLDRFTDSAVAAEACRTVLDAAFMYVPNLSWFAWEGCVWREVEESAVVEAVRRWVDESLAEAALSRDTEAVKGWVRYQSLSKVRAVVEFARGILSVPASKLDADPDLLNTPNGVVDLRTGELRPSMPWHYMTKVTGCEFDPKATHDDWAAALAALPDSVLTWCQIRYGQGITGHPPTDDRTIVQQGGGENGKSTVMAAVRAALGDYYLACTERVLLPASKDAIGPELAGLRGARFVVIEETPEAGRLDTQRLKAVVGTPTITARLLYRDYFTFKASHTLFVNTNFTPIVAETDHGTWRRLLLLVFPYRFTASPLDPAEKQGDTGLRSRLEDEAQRRAVLAWLVEGARRWYAEGFPPVPPIVESDTVEWRGLTDHVDAFWSEYIEAAPEHYVAVTDLMRRFNEYLRDLGNAPMSEALFSRRFRDHQRTAAAGVIKRSVRMTESNRARFSRPHRDLWKTLPPLPDGVLKAWVGVRFRGDADASSGESVTDVTA